MLRKKSNDECKLQSDRENQLQYLEVYIPKTPRSSYAKFHNYVVSMYYLLHVQGGASCET